MLVVRLYFDYVAFNHSLAHYSPVLLFYTPRKHHKTFRFSWGIEKQHRAEMG